MEKRLPAAELAGGLVPTPSLYTRTRWFGHGKCIFVRQVEGKFQQLRQRQRFPSGNSILGVGWTSEEEWIRGRAAVCLVNESQDSAINSSSQENMPPCQPTHHPINKQTHNGVREGELSKEERGKRKKKPLKHLIFTWEWNVSLITYRINLQLFSLNFSVNPTYLKHFELHCASNCGWIF